MRPRGVNCLLIFTFSCYLPRLAPPLGGAKKKQRADRNVVGSLIKKKKVERKCISFIQTEKKIRGLTVQAISKVIIRWFPALPHHSHELKRPLWIPSTTRGASWLHLTWLGVQERQTADRLVCADLRAHIFLSIFSPYVTFSPECGLVWKEKKFK